MLKLNNKMLTVVLSVVLVTLSGCKPTHKVLGTESLRVYHVSATSTDMYGKYEYWITDSSSVGWVLITDVEYDIGDYLEIKVKVD